MAFFLATGFGAFFWRFISCFSFCLFAARLLRRQLLAGAASLTASITNGGSM